MTADDMVSPSGSQASFTAWFDPGKTTGIAGWDSRTGTFTSLEASSDLTEIGKWVELLLLVNDQDPDFRLAIGWERYVVTPGNARHGTAYWSLEVIGVLKYLALKHGVTILKPQMSSMMATSTDKRLKAIGWHKPGKPHANDAARHLLRYMLKAGTLPIEIWDIAYCDEVLEEGLGARRETVQHSPAAGELPRPQWWRLRRPQSGHCLH